MLFVWPQVVIDFEDEPSFLELSLFLGLIVGTEQPVDNCFFSFFALDLFFERL
jgi:hypothetical protein